MKELKTYDFTAIESNVLLYINYMLDRTQSMFKWKNLPETIDERTLERRLQENGFVIFTYIDESEIIPNEEIMQPGGVYAMEGSYGGVLDFNGNPIFSIIAHPLLKGTKKVYFGKEAVLARNDSKMIGLIPMFNRYARAIVENDLSLFRADQQARATALISANTNKTLESAKRYIESIKKGDLGFVVQENIAEQSIRTQPLFSDAGNQITNLIELQQFLKGSWFNEIGINANFNMKRETILESESDLNSDATQPFVDELLKERKRICEEINRLFNLNVSVELDSSWNKEEKMTANNEEIQEEELNNDEGTTAEITEEREETTGEELPEEVQEGKEEVIEEDTEEPEQEPEVNNNSDTGSSEEQPAENSVQIEENPEGVSQEVKEPEQAINIEININAPEEEKEEEQTNTQAEEEQPAEGPETALNEETEEKPEDEEEDKDK